MALSKERRGEIAYLYIKDKLRREGFRINDLKRRVHEEAQRLSITPEEAREFVEGIIRELIHDLFDSQWHEK